MHYLNQPLIRRPLYDQIVGRNPELVLLFDR